MAAGETAAAITVGALEVIKFLIMAHNSAIKAGMPPEEYKKLAEAISTGFIARDPAALPKL